MRQSNHEMQQSLEVALDNGVKNRARFRDITHLAFYSAGKRDIAIASRRGLAERKKARATTFPRRAIALRLDEASEAKPWGVSQPIRL